MGNDPVTWPDVSVPQRVRPDGHLGRRAAQPAVDAELVSDMRDGWTQPRTEQTQRHGRPRRRDAAHHHRAARRAGLRRQRRPSAAHARPCREQRGEHGRCFDAPCWRRRSSSARSSALLGVVLGVVAARGAHRLDRRATGSASSGRSTSAGGCSPRSRLCAIASTMIAALAPARRLGRLDIVGVMRGQSVSAPPSIAAVRRRAGARRHRFRGHLLLHRSDQSPTLRPRARVPRHHRGRRHSSSAALFLVPVLLTLVGRLGGRMPTSLRMAARDLARHRSRSAPSVAAVLAAVAGLTFGLTGLSSDTEQQKREYLPSTLPGEVLVSAWNVPLTTEQVRGAASGLVVSENTDLRRRPRPVRLRADHEAVPCRVRQRGPARL